MKSMISCLAAVVVVLAVSACGKTDCTKLKKDDCIKGDNAMVCVLDGDACKAKDDASICSDAAANEATCKKAAGHLNDSKKTCNWDAAASSCSIGDKK